MSKPPSPLLGFNNNVRHKGRVFHIQTEDSGIRHPHVITHLFMDGGRILKTSKTSYAEHVGIEGYAEKVRGLMKQQHKAMFIALRDGDFDAIISGSAPASKSQSSLPMQVLPPPEVIAAMTSAAEVPVSPKHAITEAPPPAPPLDPTARPTEQGAPSPPPMSHPPPGFDAAAIERAAAAAEQDTLGGDGARISSTGIAPGDLPPPPTALLAGNRPRESSYREVTQPDQRRSRPPPRPSAEGSPRGRISERPLGARKSTRPPPGPSIPVSRPPSSGRYAVSKPGTPLAGTSRPPEGRSIFGEDLISEKSLDEVILSYLAEDLEAAPPKK